MVCASCKSRETARICALAYVQVNVGLLSTDVGFMLQSAMMCEENRRPYIWLTHGFTCFLRTMNLGFVVLWIISASQDNLRLMIFSSTAILGRLVATILHAFTPGSIDLYSASFKADAYQLIALHPEELTLGNVGMFIFLTAVIEVAFVSPLIVYQQGFYMRKEREAAVASDEVHAQAQTSTGHREHSGDDYSDELSIEADGDRPARSSDHPATSSWYTGSEK